MTASNSLLTDQTTEDSDDEEEQETYNAREPAWRMFAAEFNDARVEVSDGGERSPTYVLTPLGARVNRLLVVGVLTGNETVGDEGAVRRAQITDPTGVFHVYAGQYQPEALQALQEMEPPAIVAVVGKARTYSPEEGVVYTSIRPETVETVSSQDRDAWIVEAAEHSLERVRAMQTATSVEDQLTLEALTEQEIRPRVAQGVLDALEHYGPADLEAYLSLVGDALGYLMPAAPEPKMVSSTPEPAQEATEAPDQATTAEPASETEPAATPATAGEQPEPATSEDEEPLSAQTVEVPEGASAEPAETAEDGVPVDAEGVVFDLVEELDGGDGALWDDIVSQAQEAGLAEEDVEEAMNLLMDRGRVFEPVLGRLKPT